MIMRRRKVHRVAMVEGAVNVDVRMKDGQVVMHGHAACIGHHDSRMRRLENRLLEDDCTTVHDAEVVQREGMALNVDVGQMIMMLQKRSAVDGHVGLHGVVMIVHRGNV